jgi:hypothetical protein
MFGWFRNLTYFLSSFTKLAEKVRYFVEVKRISDSQKNGFKILPEFREFFPANNLLIVSIFCYNLVL